MKSFIIVFGKPNAGKGTRLNEAKKQDGNFTVISVGDLLREERKNKTELGKLAESYMDSGKLVPDDVINSIVINKLEKADTNMIADGYPRTNVQAEAMLQSGVYPDFVINLQVPDEVIIQRAADRLVCQNCGETFTATNDFKKPKVQNVCDECGGPLGRRKDDNPETVAERLKTYAEQTEPVLKVLADAGIKIYNLDNTAVDASKAFMDILNLATKNV